MKPVDPAAATVPATEISAAAVTPSVPAAASMAPLPWLNLPLATMTPPNCSKLPDRADDPAQPAILLPTHSVQSGGTPVPINRSPPIPIMPAVCVTPPNVADPTVINLPPFCVSTPPTFTPPL